MKRTLIAIAAALATLLPTITAAEAASATRSDPRGDQWGGQKYDILRFSANRMDTTVSLRWRMRVADPRGRIVLIAQISNAGPRGNLQPPIYRVGITRRADGSTFGAAYDATSPVELPRIECRVKTSWNSDTGMATARLASSCLDVGPRMRIQGFASSVVGTQDPNDLVSPMTLRAS